MLARENPFAADRAEGIRYKFLDGDWETFLAKAEKAGWRGAIVGPEGSGKTTLLAELRDRLHSAGNHTVWLRGRFRWPWLQSDGWRQLGKRIDSRTFIFVDSAECIPAPVWWLIRLRCLRAKGVLITLHRPGRMQTLHATRTSPGLLQQIVHELTPHMTPDGDLFEKHEGNIRAAIRELYDTAAGLTPQTGHSIAVHLD